MNRAEWFRWLFEHESRYRSLMQTAPRDRRRRSQRMYARAGLPEPAQRIPPVRDSWRPVCRWETLLWNRTGWHAVRVREQMHLIFTVVYDFVTYFFDIDPGRSHRRRIRLPSNFDPTTNFHHLKVLADEFVGSEVTPYEVTMICKADNGGIVVSVQDAKIIDKPARRQRTVNPETASDSEECDYDGEAATGASDASSVQEVDTEVSDGEAATGASSASSDSSSDSDTSSSDTSDASHASGVIKVGHHGSKAKAESKKRKGELVLWSDGLYFTISMEPVRKSVNVRIQNRWLSTDEMGRKSQSKSLTPAHFGESFDSPDVACILLRAWALWRANLDGWASQFKCREEHFAKVSRDIVNDAKKLNADAQKLLTKKAVSKKLRTWAPAVAAAVCA